MPDDRVEATFFITALLLMGLMVAGVLVSMFLFWPVAMAVVIAIVLGCAAVAWRLVLHFDPIEPRNGSGS